MVSLIVVAVAAVGVIIGITGDDEAATIDFGSGESVYMQYDWYAELDGFYLPPPVGAPSGESAYMEYDWYANMGGFYLAEPYGDLTPDSHYSWLVERGLIPEVYDLSTPGLQVVNADGVGWYYAPAPATHSDYDWLVHQGIIPEAYDGPTSDYEWLVEQGIIPEAFEPALPAGLQVVTADGVGWYYAPAPATVESPVSPNPAYDWLVAEGIIPEAYDEVTRPPFAPHSGN